MKILSDISVLVIDDDAGMLRALERVLTSEGADVTAASWAGDAVEMLTSHATTFDLVITDLRMPFVTGLTVVYAVHKIYPALPVIVLSAFGSPDVKEECLRQGASAFLEKPLNTEELIAAVEKVFAWNTNVPLPKQSAAIENDFTNEKTDPTKLSRLENGQLSSGRTDCAPVSSSFAAGSGKE